MCVCNVKRCWVEGWVRFGGSTFTKNIHFLSKSGLNRPLAWVGLWGWAWLPPRSLWEAAGKPLGGLWGASGMPLGAYESL